MGAGEVRSDARDPMKPIMLAILCNAHRRDGWLAPELAIRVCEAPYSAKRPVRVELINGYSPVDAARCEAVRRFLVSDCEWLVQIDNDTVPAPGFMSVILDAERTGKSIIGLPCVMLTDGLLNFNCGMKAGSDDKGRTLYRLASMLQHGWQKVDVVGGACLIIHRSVFSKIPQPYFEIDPQFAGRACNEDFGFCAKAQSAGFDVWVQADYLCQHFHSCDLLTLLSSMNSELDRYVKHVRDLFPGVSIPTYIDFKRQQQPHVESKAPLTLPL